MNKGAVNPKTVTMKVRDMEDLPVEAEKVERFVDPGDQSGNVAKSDGGVGIPVIGLESAAAGKVRSGNVQGHQLKGGKKSR